MAKLRKVETCTVRLDQTAEGGTAEVKMSVRMRDIEKVSDWNNKPQILNILIDSWNLEKEDGTPLPITIENMGVIDSRDALDIINASQITAPDKKKAPTVSE